MYISSLLTNNLHLMNKMRAYQIGLERSTERLSSGSRFGRLADSPADFLRMNRMESQIRMRSVTQRNLQEGISFVQTAEKSMDHVHSIVERLKELSVQYQSGTLSDDEKRYIQEEAKSLTQQISKTITGTKFNNTNVFDNGSIRLQLGTGSQDVMTIEMPKGTLPAKPNQVDDVHMNTNANEVQKEINIQNLTPVVQAVSTTTNPLTSISDLNANTKEEPRTGDSSLQNSNPLTRQATMFVPTALRAYGVQTSQFNSKNNSVSTQDVQSLQTQKASTNNVPHYTVKSPKVTIPDQQGYSGYKKIYDEKGNLLYEGNLKDGKFDGFGVLYDNGKKVYEGAWKDGVYSGYGTSYFKNGKIEYQGDFKDGTLDGWGTVYGKNGKVLYQGGLQNGYRQGWGTTYETNGKVLESKEYNDAKNAGGGTKPPVGGGDTQPPGEGGGTQPPTDGGGTKPPVDGGETQPPTDGGGTKPPVDGGDTQPPTDGGGTKPPGDGGDTQPPTDGGGTKPPVDGGGTKPPGDGGGTTPDTNFSLRDLDKMNIDDLLKGDFLEKVVSKQVNDARISLGITHQALERRIDFESDMQAIEEESFSRINDVDTAKEMMIQVRQEMLKQVSTSLFVQNLDQHRSFILELLRG